MIGYLLIPLVTVLISVAGSAVTASGMPWYSSLLLPSWTPDGALIGIVWSVIYILATISALLIWHRRKSHARIGIIMLAFLVNAALNVLWSAVFFGWHMLFAAILAAALLALSVLALIIVTWPVSRLASLLLLPYVLWVSFATFLTYSVWGLNG